MAVCTETKFAYSSKPKVKEIAKDWMGFVTKDAPLLAAAIGFNMLFRALDVVDRIKDRHFPTKQYPADPEVPKLTL